jgi:flagella basal body P-ring formation protein FlgA
LGSYSAPPGAARGARFDGVDTPARFALLSLLRALVATLALQGGAHAGEIEQQAQQFALAAATTGSARIEIEVGALDPRLRLAPCARVEPYVPAGTRLWGRSRIGLRCASGPVAWNVYLPLVVKVYGRAAVAARALPAGTLLSAADLQEAEVDIAQGAPPLRAADPALGRVLARPLAAGQALRGADLRARQWFAAGETVQVVAVGSGFRISGEGQALGPGLEGQSARVRVEGGRIVTGQPVAARTLEIRL